MKAKCLSGLIGWLDLDLLVLKALGWLLAMEVAQNYGVQMSLQGMQGARLKTVACSCLMSESGVCCPVRSAIVSTG